MPNACPHRQSLADWTALALRPLDQRPARHHQLLIEHLERLAAGDIDRLMVLMPPGSAKSTYASVLLPPWWLARHPRNSIVAVCHTANLAAHFGRRSRNVAAGHKEALGYLLASDQRAAESWSTNLGGDYYACGVRGPVTGRRADLVLIDDPIKSHAEADSSLHRDHVWDWYRSDLVTRLKPNGRVALIMTRWHEDDLGGRLLAGGDRWTVLRLPAIAEPTPDRPDPLGRAAGEPLWPEWEDEAALMRKRAMVGSRVWSALYQQSPRPDEGALFPVPRIVVVDESPRDLREVRAWDLAATEAGEGRDPDWTVGLKLGCDGSGRLFVLDVVRFRGGPAAVEAAITATAASDGRAVPVGLPQDPGQAGKQQVAWLAGRLHGYRVVASPESGAKLTRALPVAAQAEAGSLAIVRAPWNRAFLDELADFPRGRKDDQVDALARAHAMLADRAAPARRLFVPLMAR